MTKDWDSVQDEIKKLSWEQKKRLDEVRKIMESKHGFKASTRAYRMKLSEWGYITRKNSVQRPSKDQKGMKRKRTQEESDEDTESEATVAEAVREGQVEEIPTVFQDSEGLETVLLGRATVRGPENEGHGSDTVALDGIEDLLPALPYSEAIEQDSEANVTDSPQFTGAVMDMLDALLEADSQKLESIILQHPNDVNVPIGEPFEDASSQFYCHPALSSCVIMQHPGQTLMDIACALPTGPFLWVLLAYAAKGSKHPLGTDLALHNAIKNGRLHTVQALTMPNRSNVLGEPGTTWTPILQAVYWNHPNIVRQLLDRGAGVNGTSPWVDGTLKNALLHCTERRQRDFMNQPAKDNCNKILKILLNAGADIHALPGGEGSPTVFETFLRPWQGDAHWISKVSEDEMDCLEAFIRKGAELKTPFVGFTCGAPSYSHFQHQMLWHTTPAAARLLVDNASPIPESNGCTLLHEIVGACPDAKRHPSDTLRDIEVLLGKGADPNQLDESHFTPLRRCIERCPAVDIIPRLRLLLDGGADPELKHSNRLAPYVLAARTFEEPLRSQIMDFFVAKIRGRQNRVVYDDSFEWTPGYFPIPQEPTWGDVQMYNGQNGDFNANLERMIPEDVRSVFQRACFSVASMNYLNFSTLRVKMSHPLAPTVMQKDEIYQAVAQRAISGLPVYSFDQDFVMLLLKPQMAPVLSGFTNPRATSPNPYLLPHQTPIQSSAQEQPSILATSCTFQFNATPIPEPHRATSPSSDAELVPETTLIRWRDIGTRTRSNDITRAKENVLRHRCKECHTGTLLTKAELDKHEVEHEHSKWCVEEECRRRFCVQRIG